MDHPTKLVAAAVSVFNRVGDLDRTVALIEAAPELLATLRNVTRELTPFAVEHPDLKPIWEAGLAAIAKAESK